MYQRAWQDIQARRAAVEQDLLLRKPERLARLREMQASVEESMRQVDEQARQWVTGDLPRAYQLGAQNAAAGFAWTPIHHEAATVLARDAYADLLAASKTVRRTTRKFIREAGKAAVIRNVVEGDTAVQAARRAARELVEQHGIHAVVYSDGSRHGLAEYTEMAVRTKSAVTYNEGSFNQMRQFGIVYAECFDGPSCGLDTHGGSPLANGLVLPVEEARQHPISHPRCQRSWSPRPDITTPAEAKTAEPTTTAAQREDAARAEAERIAGQRARQSRKRRADRTQPRRPKPRRTREESPAG